MPAPKSTAPKPEPGIEIDDPTCGSGGLLFKRELAVEEAAKGKNQINRIES
ncbi:MAG: hypothetical protein V4640_16200 [Verrucomicrobiota bacterium]